MAGFPREFNWSRLDNTGKMFPAVSGELSTNVFRVSAELREDVDPETLTVALYLTLTAVPAFQVKLRRGLFWYYFEQNYRKPRVRAETEYPCSPLRMRENDGFLFSVTYFKRRVNLEVFHVLADGTGALYFLSHLLLHYLRLLHPEAISANVVVEPQATAEELQEDGFLKAYTTAVEAENSTFDRAPALPIVGTLLPLGAQQVMEASMSAGALLRLAKEQSATVTEYLAAEIFLALHAAYGQGAGEPPVKVSIPVNLRSFFPSRTVKNFFIFVRFAVDFKGEELSFEEVLSQIRQQMDREVNRERFQRRIRYHVDLEKKRPLRLVPRPIKDVGMRVAYRMAERGYTCTFTNLGRVQFPKQILPYLEQVSVLLNASRNNTLKISLASLEDRMVMTFVSSIQETEVQRRIITALTARGVDVTLRSNGC